MGPYFSIATVALPSGGAIGIAPLPGKTSLLSVDIAAIRTWRAHTVVSMTLPAEAEAIGVAGIGEALALAGINREQFPVDDFGIPDPQMNAAWPMLSRRLHARLDEGKNVLLHCMGGKGRSGMVALKLLVERGEDPAGALARIRQVRPGAVETEAQFLWAVEGHTNPTTALAR